MGSRWSGSGRVSELRRSWKDRCADFIEQRFARFESAPGRGQIQDKLVTGASGDRAADQERLTQRGGASLDGAGFGIERLQDAEQIENEQDGQKCGLGGEELAQTKIIG